jgi:spermidine synthase
MNTKHKMNTYTEQQPWGSSSYTVYPNSHVHFQTKQQKVDLITNPHFGRMLFLENTLQLASADEYLYHRPLAQLGMKQRPQPRILVAGGADGALLREIQDHDGKYDLGVKEMVLVDWDEELLKYLRDEEPYNCGSFDDPRLQVLFEDIQTYLEHDLPPFDSIFLDLLDPKTEEDLEWTKQLLQKSVAKCRGTVGLNAGSDLILVEKLVTFGEESFPHHKVHVETIMVPSFQEPWYLLFMSKNVLEEPVHQDAHKMTPENL